MAGICRTRGLWGAASATVALALLTTGAPARAQDDAPCGGAEAAVSGPVERSDLPRLTSTIRCLVLQERRDHGLGSLTGNARLRVAATKHSRDMVRRHYFDHRSPGGSQITERVAAEGYLKKIRSYSLGEAIGFGIGTESSPQAIVDEFMNSPAHRDLILDPTFKDMGVGVAIGAPRGAADDQPALTVTLAFGRVSR